jgi:DNA-directed RNA polymerase specialized sigma24 family protein
VTQLWTSRSNVGAGGSRPDSLSQRARSRKLGCSGVDRDLRSDDELLLATATGDAEAFAVFYRRHVGEVLGHLARWTGSYELAADLTGEAFAGALLGCRPYRPGGAPALAWLLGIAHNKLRESARHGRIVQRARERLGIPALALDDEGLLQVEELATSCGKSDGV